MCAFAYVHVLLHFKECASGPISIVCVCLVRAIQITTTPAEVEERWGV